ncbi:MAG: trypsin-like peptidase domain-containing protein [Armatimonadota bacterium]|nr:trypsin-like peptidase domain-containing protein [Armatimonadota bacterium]MDR7562046.1 trypsin-like peptidase domain-containing protein [Armatimonadota bacterium]MDR7567284.1 trypsin-like peptidase domain-containing protein [Armatimonadota bacterium]
MRRGLPRILGAACLVGFLLSATWAQGFDPQVLYQRAAPAVAVVETEEDGRRGLGAAFAIQPNGWLLTAAHVVRGAEEITVGLNAARYSARLVGYDARRDLALLHLAPRRPVPSLPLGSAVRVGDPVATIGHPRGRVRVMTVGTVATLRDTLPGLLPGIMIRFRGEVTRGNSGGPLLNARGEAVGLVVATTFERGTRSGLAVSADAILAVLPALRAGARLERAWIGIAGETLEPLTAMQQGISAREGVLVLEVVPGSPARAAGLRVGDAVVAFDGEPIRTWEDLLVAVSTRKPGEGVRLRVVRGSRVLEVRVILGVRP